jgi:DNA-directed RNA polymerase alpha subunit
MTIASGINWAAAMMKETKFSQKRARKAERTVREAVAEPMLDPTPELPDDTLIEQVRFSTRIQNALNTAGIKTVGEVADERYRGYGKSCLD